MDVKACADEVVRLELARVPSSVTQSVNTVAEAVNSVEMGAGACSSDDLVDAIASRVLETLKVADEANEFAVVRPHDGYFQNSYSQHSLGGGKGRGNNRSLWYSVALLLGLAESW